MTLIEQAAGPGRRPRPVGRLVDRFEQGLDAPICLTWELTYACNLACVHCLSSSGRRDPHELSTEECKAVIDEFERMQIFYVNIGGGEPTIRSDFWELVEYATDHHVGVKFSTNGSRITDQVAERLAGSDYVDVQISLDGATAAVNDAVRGAGLLRHRRDGHGPPGPGRLRRLQAVGGGHPAQRRPAGRLQGAGRPLRRPAPTDPAPPLRAAAPTCGTSSTPPPTSSASSTSGCWPTARTCSPATPSSTWPATASPCPASTCAVPVGWCAWWTRWATSTPARSPSTTSSWPATSGSPGGFTEVWRHSDLFTELRRPQSAGACGSCGHYDSCRGGCMAAKFFTGLPLDGPDPECVLGHGEQALAGRGGGRAAQALARPLAAGRPRCRSPWGRPTGHRWPRRPGHPTARATRAPWPAPATAPDRIRAGRHDPAGNADPARAPGRVDLARGRPTRPGPVGGC